MTQLFDQEGNIIPVTAIKIEKNIVTALKNTQKHGYSAIQVGFGDQKEKHITKAQATFFKKNNLPIKRVLMEFRLTPDEVAKYQIGQEIPLTAFETEKAVDITGITKGRGFAGVIKRYKFSGFPGSHGTHEYFRHPGSIGCRTDPGRVMKNKRLPGHYGTERVTIQNLKIVKIDQENNILLIRGAVPGANNSIVRVTVRSKKSKKAA